MKCPTKNLFTVWIGFASLAFSICLSAYVFAKETKSVSDKASKRVAVKEVDGASTADYQIKRSVALLGRGKGTLYTQSRASILPGGDPSRPSVIITTQKTVTTSTHNYQDFYQIRSDDQGKTWSKPRVLPSMKRKVINERGDQQVIGDFWPKLHKKTDTVLGTGKVFTFTKGKKEDKSRKYVSYSVYDDKQGTWNGLNILKLPRLDKSGQRFTEPNAGCVQRVDLPDGDILLPIYYRRENSKARRNIATVVRCGFDGKQLTYKEHGTELVMPRDRGFCEPSLARYQDRYFLTLRTDHSAFVARSDDGLNFEPPKEWKFDDGKVLGSHNTQQHWVVQPGGKGLYLVYTRRGAKNKHIMRHRAPLFIAKVDPDRLCVLHDTERILIPENNATMGNFGVAEISPSETWIVVAESPRKKRKNDKNKTIVAKILWKE